MKWSKFNYIVEDNINKKIIVMNVYNNYCSRFGEETSNIIRNIVNGKFEESKDEKLFKYLENKGFLVDKNLDEEKLEKNKIEESKNNDGMLHFIIMPTDDCNFRCTYCYEEHFSTHMRKEYADKILKYIDLHIEEYKGVTIEWYGGEPLLEMEFIEYFSKKAINICNMHKKRYTASMTTNGALLTADVFRKLRKLRVTTYQITIDGLKYTHDKQRPFAYENRSSWDTIINNLIEIKDTCRLHGIYFLLRTNFTNRMLDDIEEYATILTEHFGNNNHFGVLWKTVGDYGGERVKKLKDEIIEFDELAKYMKVVAEKGLRIDMLGTMFLAGGNACHSSKHNTYVLGTDEIVRKSTCLYENECNYIGYFTEDGELVIDSDKEEKWVNGFCCPNKECKFRLTCIGNGCPQNNIFYSKPSCIWGKRIDEYIYALCSIEGFCDEYIS